MEKLIRYASGFAVPPLGVFFTYGISSAFFINLPLTFLGWLPGSIHAVWAISRHYETLDSPGDSTESNFV